MTQAIIRPYHRILNVVITLSLLFASQLAWAQTPSDWSGDWQGQLEVAPGMALTLVLHLKAGETGYNGTIDSPDQGAFGIPVNDIKINADELTLAISAIGANYRASLKSDRLSGTFKQMGKKFPLTLERQSNSQAQVIAEPPVRPQEPQPPYLYLVEEAHYPHVSGEFEFAATLTKPKGQGPFAAAILISGSGPQDRDETLLNHKPFKVLADHLTRAGYAVLRFDDRGTAQSGGNYNEADLADFATDVASAYAYLSKRPDIASDKIGVIGHSEGGVTGPMFASQQPKVAFVIMLAGVGVPGKEIWATQQRDLAVASGMGDGELIYQLQAQAAQLAIDGASAQTISKHLMTYPEAPQEMADGIARVLTSRWGRSLMAYQPEPVLSQLKMPLLAINGELDMQVASQANLDNIGQIMKSSGNKDVTLLPLKGLNHLFQQASTGHPNEYAQIDETLNPKLLSELTHWLNERFL